MFATLIIRPITKNFNPANERTKQATSCLQTGRTPTLSNVYLEMNRRFYKLQFVRVDFFPLLPVSISSPLNKNKKHDEEEWGRGEKDCNKAAGRT